MFNLSYPCFWIVLITYPLSFGDPIYETALLYGDFLQRICLFLCILSYISKPTKRQKSCLILMGLYGVYSQIADILFSEVTSILYILESLAFFSWAVWLMLRPEIKTVNSINHTNILLAFYKGEKGSFAMNFFELFGLPVKSMCIIAGDKALYLKSNKRTFEFGNSEKIYRKSDDYVIIDTGKPYTKDYITEMKKHSNIIATRGILRIRCIEAVRGLLSMIGEEYKPNVYIPSLYLRRILK